MSRRQPTKQNEEEEEEEVPPEATQRQKLPGMPIASNKRGMLKVAPKPEPKRAPASNAPPRRKPYIPKRIDDDKFSRFILDDPRKAYKRISEGPLEQENVYLQIELSDAASEIQRLKEENEDLKAENHILRFRSVTEASPNKSVPLYDDEKKKIRNFSFTNQELGTKQRKPQKRFFRVLRLFLRYTGTTYKTIYNAWTQPREGREAVDKLIDQVATAYECGDIEVRGLTVAFVSILNADEVFAHSCGEVIKKAKLLLTNFKKAQLEGTTKEAQSLIQQLEQALIYFNRVVREQLGELLEEDEKEEDDEENEEQDEQGEEEDEN